MDNTPTNEVTKERDVENVKTFLVRTLNRLTYNMPRPARNAKGANEAYRLQTEMAYLINELDQGPACMQQVYIQQANELLDQLLIADRARRQKAQQESSAKPRGKHHRK